MASTAQQSSCPVCFGQLTDDVNLGSLHDAWGGKWDECEYACARCDEALAVGEKVAACHRCRLFVHRHACARDGLRNPVGSLGASAGRGVPQQLQQRREATLESFGCTDAQVAQGMQLAAKLLRDVRGVENFSDQQLCEVFAEFITQNDNKPADALREMKLRIWGSDASRWPEEFQVEDVDLETLSVERISKAKTVLVGFAMVTAALSTGLCVATANPVLAKTACVSVAVVASGNRTHVHLGRSALAMDDENFKKLDIVERGRVTHFTWLVMLGGMRWTISRTRTDFVELLVALDRRLGSDTSGTFCLPSQVRKLFPSTFRSSETQQARFECYLEALVECALGQTILAETIHAFFQPTHEDRARFGAPLPMSSEATLGGASSAASSAPEMTREARHAIATSCSGRPIAACGFGNNLEAAAKQQRPAGLLHYTSAAAAPASTGTPRPAVPAPMPESAPQCVSERGNPFAPPPPRQMEQPQLAFTIETFS